LKEQELTQLFYDLFVELSERYADVKKWVLLAEEMADKFPIASVNELRNALDHFFRTTDQFDEEAIRTEFDSVRRHITRAGYDACNGLVYVLWRHPMLKSSDSHIAYLVIMYSYLASYET